MMDKEIIKILNTATNIDGLQICCIDYENAPETKTFLSIKSDIVDLINQQQAEVERLQQEMRTKDGVVLEIFENKRTWERLAKIKVIKEFADRLKEEITTRIVELKATKSKYVKENYKCLSCDYIAKIRGEIEFLESLKEFIDNLVKEMVSDDK